MLRYLEFLCVVTVTPIMRYKNSRFYMPRYIIFPRCPINVSSKKAKAVKGNGVYVRFLSREIIFLTMVIGIGMFTGSNGYILANDNNDINARAVYITRQLYQRLSLSNEQASKIQRILTKAIADQPPPASFSSPQDQHNYEAQMKQKLQDQISPVLTPQQQQLFQQMPFPNLQQTPPQSNGQNNGSMPGGRRHHHRHQQDMQNGMDDQNSGQQSSPQYASQAYSSPQSQQPTLSQTQQPVQELNAMYNPKTGQTFPSQYKYDPSTGESLISRQ